jgi:hypothetical protein
MSTHPRARIPSRRRFPTLLLSALLLAAVSSPGAAQAGGSRHPFFNDGGTLGWYRTLAGAKRAARREGKLIFVEYGRSACGNCRHLAERILPHPRIRGRLSAAAVGLAADCDHPEGSVYWLFRRNLPGARMLPFVAFLTEDGQWVTGWSGSRSLEFVSQSLEVAEARLMRARKAARAQEPSAAPARPARAHAQPTARPHPPREAPHPTREAPHPTREAPHPTREAPHPTREAPQAVREEPKPAAKPCPSQETHAAPSAPEEADAGEGGGCEGGSCRAPTLPCLPNPLDLFRSHCKPKTTCPPKPCPTKPCRTMASPAKRARPAPEVAQTCPDFPPPAPRCSQPARPLAAAPQAFPVAAPQAGKLPAPVVQPTPAAPRASTPVAQAPKAQPAVVGSPDGDAAPVADPRVVARRAATRGDWATVLRATHGAGEAQPELKVLNHRAHLWAHGRLAFAVRALWERQFDKARDAMDAVRVAMRGEPESVDAERGIEALELMRDIEPLAEKSLVRRTVRKTAYEKMRGTRWAPLFSPVAQPTPAVADR